MKDIYFIAEIGVNHEAKIESALKHILDAKKGGAQAVKLQVYKAEKIVSKLQNLTGINPLKKKRVS